MRPVSTIHLVFTAILAAIVAELPAKPVLALELKPYADKLFAYPGILESRDNGDFIKVDYQKSRDIYERDDIPERKVKWQYVSRGVTWHQSFDTLDLPAGKLDIFEAGKIGGQTFSVIFIHGRGGDRKLGASDDRFGGNFNRLKNLAVDNGGVYVAPTIKGFDDKSVEAGVKVEKGVAQVSALVKYMRQSSGGHPVILACASMGSLICQGIARDPGAVAVLSGMVLMSASPDQAFETTPLYTAHVPVFFAHSTDDIVYKYQDQVALYDDLHKKRYPTRFVLFNTGSHGTPLRMLDWRDTLNWFFKQ